METYSDIYYQPIGAGVRLYVHVDNALAIALRDKIDALILSSGLTETIIAMLPVGWSRSRKITN